MSRKSVPRCRRNRAAAKNVHDAVLSARTFWAVGKQRRIAGKNLDGTYVAEGTLTVRISELHKAFGDDKKKPRFIATVPRDGLIRSDSTEGTRVEDGRVRATCLSDQNRNQDQPPEAKAQKTHSS